MPADWNLYRLRVFARVAETLSFSEAARQLCVAQPAISQYIRELEEAVGVRLFERTARGVALTEAGTSFFQHTRIVIAATDELQEAVNRIKSRSTGDLKLAASTSWTHILPIAINAFNKSHPGVVTRLTMGVHTQVVELVLRNEVDLGFLSSFGVDLAKLEVIPMGNDQVLLVAAPEHPLVRRRFTHAGIGEPMPMVYVLSDRLTLGRAKDYLNSFGLKAITRAVLPSPELVKEALLDGMGVGFQLKSQISAELMRGRLVPLSPDIPPCKVTLCAFRNARRLRTRVHEAFLAEVTNVLGRCGIDTGEYAKHAIL